MIIVPIITPYHFNEITRVIDHIIAGGVRAILLVGTTGEFLKLTTAQKKTLIHIASDHIGDRAQLLIHITSPTLADTIDLMHTVDQTQALASVVIPLLLGAHSIETLLSSSTGNLFLYNNPQLTQGQSLPIKDIPLHPRIFGIKDSSGNPAYFDELLKLKKNSSLKVFYGPESHLHQALHKDIDGFVPGTGNIAPQLACALWEKKDHGPWDEWQALKATIKAKNPHNYIAGLKLMLNEIGIISDARLF